jgi:signal transduction histidine kinase/CheY-like chemotaxis protein
MSREVARSKSRYFPVVSAILLLGLMTLATWLVYEYKRQTGWVQHTLEVQKQLGSLLSKVQDAETGVRGFILTGEDSYLEVYNSALLQLPGNLESLRAQISGDAGQSLKFAELQSAVQRRIAHLKDATRIRRMKGLADAVEFVKTNRGYNIMQEVRTLIADMQMAEERLYDIRQSGADRLIGLATFVALCGVVLLVLSLTAWMWSNRQHVRIVAQAEVERLQAEEKMRQMQKIEALGQLTGGVAHDFNNMLAVITSGLSLIKRRLNHGNVDVLELIDATMDGATRAATLTSRLMAFARKQPLEAQVIDASKIMRGLSTMLERTLGAGVTVELRLADNCWPTLADPVQLETAVLNLCVNARDAMDGSGRVVLVTENLKLDRGDVVHISISDSGTGMSSDVLARAFDPFFTTKDVGKGTGLGLSQVHGFVKQIEGDVSVDSRVGSGTTVHIYLPRHRGHEGGSSSPQVNADAPPDHSCLILVVDDEAVVRQLSAKMLRELGYQVHEADGASSAMRLLDENPDIALLFTDIVMPGMNGLDLARQAVRNRPALKVLFTTGYSRHGDLPAGMDRMIAKPFTLDSLAAKVRDTLQS